MIANAPFMPADPTERFTVIFRALQRSVADNGYRLKIHVPRDNQHENARQSG